MKQRREISGGTKGTYRNCRDKGEGEKYSGGMEAKYIVDFYASALRKPNAIYNKYVQIEKNLQILFIIIVA